MNSKPPDGSVSDLSGRCEATSKSSMAGADGSVTAVVGHGQRGAGRIERERMIY